MLRIFVEKCNEYSLTIELAKSRRFPTKKITDADYANDLAVLPDNSYNAQKLLDILKQSAVFIGLYVNATELNIEATIRTVQWKLSIKLLSKKLMILYISAGILPLPRKMFS